MVTSNRKLEITEIILNIMITIFTIIGLIVCFYELGFIYAYRSGFKIGLLSPLLSVAVMVILAIVGVLFFKEKISMMNTIGLIIASIGVLMTIQ